MTSMTERTWKFDRTNSLPPGPWRDEPDKIQWIDAATGLDCLIKRNGSGALCGYVGLPPEHPWHGKGYGECLLTDCVDEFCWEHSPDGKVQVHGGLTFASSCNESGGDDAICHVPFPGRPAEVWWFGFDCAHEGDKCPDYERNFLGHPDIYRDVPYVRAECASLAAQLLAVAS